jgi:hypothetical protein
MVSEINVIVGGAVGAVVSGLAGLFISWRTMHRTQERMSDSREELAWERHQTDELSRNLLVLEMVGDKVESAPIDVAVRARLTPAEMRQATEDLTAAGLVDEPHPNLVRVTETGRKVLADHKLELEDSLINRHQRKDAQRSRQSPEDLDVAIDNAVKSLRAQHAH